LPARAARSEKRAPSSEPRARSLTGLRPSGDRVRVDASTASFNNAIVIRPAARAAALLVVAPFLTFASALAPQHIHEPEPGHDHDQPVAHSHFAPHHAETHDHVAESCGVPFAADKELDHDDEHVVWLDSSTLHESPYQVHRALAAVPVGFETACVERHWAVTPSDDGAPAHGPPRPSSPFRGPPPSAV